jgi:hypothetical protein
MSLTLSDNLLYRHLDAFLMYRVISVENIHSIGIGGESSLDSIIDILVWTRI